MPARARDLLLFAAALSAACNTPRADAGSDPKPAPWRPFSADSPWNTPLPRDAALEKNSAALIDALTKSSEWPYLDIAMDQFSVPLYWADASTPRVKVTVNRVAGQWFHDDPRVPIPAGARPALGSDRHLAIIDRAGGREWDFWRAANEQGSWTCEVCAGIDTRTSGVRPYPEQTIKEWWMAHGARACGFPLSAGLITVEEIKAGRIEHALVIGYPGIRSRWFTPPASTAQATFPRINSESGIPCGGRIRLDPALDPEKLGLSPAGKVIARALQEYGAYVGDFNGSISLYAESAPQAMEEWRKLLRPTELRNKIDLRRFQVLPLGQLYDDRN